MTKSAGVFDLDLVPPCDDLDLLEASLLGSDRATAILWDVAQTNTDQRIPSAVPVLPPGVTFGQLRPSVENSSIELVICAKCDVRCAGVPRLVEALRGIWPKVRLLKVTHPNGGRA